MKQRLVLHNDVREIPLLSPLVDKLAGAGGVDASVAMSLNLALEEAVTNVMMYAYPKPTAGQVEVLGELEGGSVRFTIIDSGIPFDPTAVPDADTSLGVADRPIGGLGIFLIRRIMDSVRYERRDGRNILVLQKNI